MKIKNAPIRGIILATLLICGGTAVFTISATSNAKIKRFIDVEVPTSESDLVFYQGETTTDLMPIDLTFSKSDVSNLIDRLHASKYRAVYLDNDMYLRVTNDNAVQVSKDNGVTWQEYDTDSIDAKEFANWLLKNDPIPGYSIKEVQNRLKSGAEVEHLAFESGKEMYFIMDGKGVQIELIQLEELASVLIDGQRMIITSEQLPMHISEKMLKSFYDLLVSNDILTNASAEQDCSEIIRHIQENATIFMLTV